jgi:hypothetical protein
MQTGLA